MEKPIGLLLIPLHGGWGIPLTDEFQRQHFFLGICHFLGGTEGDGGLIPSGILFGNGLHSGDKRKADFGIGGEAIDLFALERTVEVKAISLPCRRDGYLISLPFRCDQTQASKGRGIRHLPGKFFGLLTIFSSQCKTTTLYYK